MALLIFLLIIRTALTTSQIKENPIFLTDKKNFFVLNSTDDYYYVVTSGQNLQIKRESGKIIKNSDNNINIENCIFIEDLSGNNYIYYLNNYYYIIYNTFILFQNISNSLKLKYDDSKEFRIVNSIALINDFIIYGYYRNELIFCRKSNKYCNSIEFSGILDDRISCKLYENKNFICIIFHSRIEIRFLKYKSDNVLKLESIVYLIQETSEYYSLFGIYDTIDSNIKLIYLKNSRTISCWIYQIELNNLEPSIYVLDSKNLVFPSSNHWTENNCYNLEFNSELLLCCAIINSIKCYRINSTTYKIIKEFNISITGNNLELFIKKGNNFITFFFINQNNNKEYAYEYYIYLPICQNNSYNIFNNNSLNYNKSEEEKERLNRLFEVKTNKYYFEIKNPPDTFGYFSLNGKMFTGRTLISDNDYILDFIRSDREITSYVEITINYILSVEDVEAYSKECHITLNLLTCYKSCETCSIDIYNSSEAQHNCIKCLDNYYPSPESNSNCYLIKEKKNNWYFDSNNLKFDFCHENCKSCSGPTKYNCTSCKNGLYLDNGYCTNKCSPGYLITRMRTDKDDYLYAKTVTIIVKFVQMEPINIL